jgi:cytosine permease
MADFWWKHRSDFPSLQSSLPAFNWAGIVAYVAASAIAYFTGKAEIGIAPVNGVVSAALLYIAFSRVILQPIANTAE